MGIIVSLFSALLGKICQQKQKRSKYEVGDGVTLFDTGNSPAARRVRITLIEKQIPFKKVDMNLLAGEQYNEEYTFVNPNRKIPAVAFKNVKGIPDGFYYESNVITELIDRVFPGEQLYSNDEQETAEIRMWQDYELGLVDDFVPLIYENLLGYICRMIYSDVDELEEKMDKNTPGPVKEKFIRLVNGEGKSDNELYQHAIACYQNLLTLERGLEGKKYLVGNRFTIADVSVFPRIDMFVSAGLPIEPEYFPNVNQWLKLISAHPSVSSSQDGFTRFQKFLVCHTPSILVTISNCKSGLKKKRIDGSDVIIKAISEAPKVEATTIPPEALDNPSLVMKDYPASSDCLQIKMLLQELNIKYETKSCHILDLIGRAAGSKGIFTVYHKNRPISGMRAIMEYLCSLSGGTRLFPQEPSVRAKIQSWQAWEQTMYIQELCPLVEMLVYSRVLVYRYKNKLDDLLVLRSQPGYQTKFTSILRCFMAGLTEDSGCWDKLEEDYGHLREKPEVIKARKEGLYKLLHIRLQHLDDTLIHQDYLVGDEETMADICVFSRLSLFSHVGMKISTQKYSHLATWLLKMQSKTSVSRLLDDINSQLSALSS